MTSGDSDFEVDISVFYANAGVEPGDSDDEIVEKVSNLFQYRLKHGLPAVLGTEKVRIFRKDDEQAQSTR